MTIYGYARISTRAQDLTGQVHALRAAGAEQVRTERGSGAARRPVWDALDETLVDGDELIITSLDRLGRVGRRLIETVEDLTARGVRLRCLSPGIDTGDPVAGTIVLYVLAALAEAERALIIERTRAGLAAARAAGRTGGRPTLITTDRLTVARRLIDDGATIAAAARTIGVHRTTLSRHLT